MKVKNKIINFNSENTFKLFKDYETVNYAFN